MVKFRVKIGCSFISVVFDLFVIIMCSFLLLLCFRLNVVWPEVIGNVDFAAK